jgi:hypothetical protein
MARTYSRRNDDDTIDEHGVLRNGQIGRARFRDAADRYFGNLAANSRVIAGDGTPEALSKPGFRHDASARRSDMAYDAKETAYQQYDQEMADAWKGDKEGYSETSEGMVCIVQNQTVPESYGAPGHIRRVNGQLICVPDSRSSAGDQKMTMDQIYEKYDQELRDSWKTPPRR